MKMTRESFRKSQKNVVTDEKLEIMEYIPRKNSGRFNNGRRRK